MTQVIDKPLYLPYLPKKMLKRRESHLMNGVRLSEKHFNIKNNENEAANTSRKSALALNGDLLKASQILLAAKSNSISETIKHAKTSDTPWNSGSFYKSSESIKPYRSSLSKNKMHSESYRKQNRSFCNSELSFASSHMSRIKPCTSIKSSNTTRSSSSSMNKTRLNPAALSSMNIYSALKQRVSSASEKSPVQVQKFAEDLLGDHLNKIYSDEPVKRVEPDVALHALNTIWELHSYALQYSEYLIDLLNKQQNSPDLSKKIKESREKSKSNAAFDYLNRMGHIFLDIEDPLISKHCLAVALGNLYHPDSIQVPGKLVAGCLALAIQMKFEELRHAALERMSHSLNEKIIGDCLTACIKHNETRAIELCQNWLEMYLVPCLSDTKHLRQIPKNVLCRALESSKLFALNEYFLLMTVAKWVFLQLNPTLDNLPNENVVITYFSSFPKDKPFVERYTDFGHFFYYARLNGIINTNSMHTIQQMNIYPHSYIVKTIMEIQYSLSHGGDMQMSRQFDTSAIRNGFVLDLENSDGYFSQIFTLYGFPFEIIAEKMCDHSFSFYIQRLSLDDPVLSFSQNQLEMFSMRTDRCCTYSISVQFWSNGDRVYRSTGIRKQRFGKANSSATRPFQVQIPHENKHQESAVDQLFVQYALIFPPD